MKLHSILQTLVHLPILITNFLSVLHFFFMSIRYILSVFASAALVTKIVIEFEPIFTLAEELKFSNT